MNGKFCPSYPTTCKTQNKLSPFGERRRISRLSLPTPNRNPWPMTFRSLQPSTKAAFKPWRGGMYESG